MPSSSAAKQPSSPTAQQSSSLVAQQESNREPQQPNISDLQQSTDQAARQPDMMPPGEQTEHFKKYGDDDAELKDLWEKSGMEIQSCVSMAAQGMGPMGGGPMGPMGGRIYF